jgi:hypothetical protein
MMKKLNSNQLRCDGVTRRDLLRVGGLTAFGLSLTEYFQLRNTASAKEAKKTPPKCILIWLDGGPSHLDMFDLKPDAPREVRGPFDPIRTDVAGIRISEYLPRTAKVMKHIALIRSMTSTLGEHNFASHYLLTGYKPTPALSYPGLGAMTTHLRRGAADLPTHMAIAKPNAMAGPGYLPPSTSPFVIDGDPAKPGFTVQDLSLYPGLTKQRLNRRRDYRAALDAFHRRLDEQAKVPASNSAFEKAYRMILSPQSKAAFDLSKEPRDLRNRYGNHSLGQRCLLARRLVESGVQFVTVTDRGWDTHDNLFNRLKEGYTGGTAGKLPKLDTAYATLLEDLDQRGMLDSTIVILMGEFGRTPKLNTRGGRDHWPGAFSVALAGGGIVGGQVIGKTDRSGETPVNRAVTPGDLVCSVYETLGINPRKELHTADGRPIQVNQHGKRIKELFA